jgi:hypothetical protein
LIQNYFEKGIFKKIKIQILFYCKKSLKISTFIFTLVSKKQFQSLLHPSRQKFMSLCRGTLAFNSFLWGQQSVIKSNLAIEIFFANKKKVEIEFPSVLL